ncbi:MAG: ABC-F family ATP-binding cassette domain-containing protein [Candidatus Melainabacteria bacterium]|nr:ABC-F family ATP-binding cassette domain-containing protein [Candidatus Melainabacteria bacterium]
MGNVLSCQSLSKSYTGRTLFDDLTFGIDEGDKIGLIGPNGSGKSTLVKILAGIVEPDDGEVIQRRDLRVSYVPQEDRHDEDATVGEIITKSGEEVGFVDYVLEASIDSTIKLFGFPDKDAKAGTLSGGWKKRLSLAKGLVQQPDVLVLDEPTNHLDLESVLALEKLLTEFDKTLIVVTHDRAFLESVTNRVVELNRQYPKGFLSVVGNYSTFLINKQEKLSEQQNLESSLASKVRREVAWLQRGARARQTKSVHRIEQAGKLIDELGEVKQRNTTSKIEIGFQSSGRKTRELVTSKSVSKSYADKKLFSNLELLITNRTRLGLVGRNGSGKTTLLKMIIGQVAPDKGEIKRAPDLKIVWFDQNRQQLDTEQTLQKALSSDSDSVVYQGRPIHITTWAKKFLFSPEQLRLPINRLSGGEQSRILIANLMLQTADIIILDEPTNDLDIPSLEVLEESLEEFPGAVILVTHDRLMLDEVSDQILALNGNGGCEYFSGYDQFDQDVDRFFADNKKAGKKEKGDTRSKNSKPQVGLSTPEKRELEGLPKKIDDAEKGLEKIHEEMTKPANMSNFPLLAELHVKQKALEKELEHLFSRWELLEAKAKETSAVT